MDCYIVEYGSKKYNLAVDLRYELLRKPLGLVFSEEDLKRDKEDILFVGDKDGIIIGTCILSKIDKDTVQLRQIAIDYHFQGNGAGRNLVEFAEKTAADLGYSKIILHARKVVVEFYEKQEYSLVGHEFTEVGIPHITMEKIIKTNTHMESKWTVEQQELLDKVARFIDINVVPFGKPVNTVLEIEKRDPMYGGNGVVYMLSVFEKGALVNNRIGVYMVLPAKGDQAGFHEHGSKKEQELYVIVHGEGKYIERVGEENETRTLNLKKGNITSIQGDNNYHSIINTGDEPLIIFVVTTYEPK
ncbi:GNAT family N-acetyltransferase [Dysgonomonas macrotermitis]|uniref:Acetyltransferase (GNAT) domain-containing protein n=1 Tax=Dysgonomonas macrotermitis TaxID=1346286 RepID=A0A1M4XWH3_9BACT|nr:GNAT family N-acetyltransferase [Dysgonomonas macrotermitis]SHE97829.1 Acetyltransferase (GNAT) domain-containing protein [Dysgonomonas macrotermitis]